MRTMTATEVSRNFASVLDRVERGQTIVITRGGRRPATLSPVPAGNGAAISPGTISSRSSPVFASRSSPESSGTSGTGDGGSLRDPPPYGELPCGAQLLRASIAEAISSRSFVMALLTARAPTLPRILASRPAAPPDVSAVNVMRTVVVAGPSGRSSHSET